MGPVSWPGIFIFFLGLVLSLSDEMIDGRERDFLRLSKRDILRLSKKSNLDPGMDYEDELLPDLTIAKRDLLRLSKKSLFQEALPLHMSQRSLRLSKRSSGLDQPMVIRLSKRQIGQLLQIKRGARDLRLSKRATLL